MSNIPTPPPTQPAEGQLTEEVALPPENAAGPIHHEKYYNTDVPDPVIIQVENCLYRQSYHYLSTHIGILAQMASLPPPPEGHEGSSDENPLYFPDVSSETFDRVLSIIYLSIYSDTSLSKMTQDDVLNVLAFCHRWEVPSAQGYCLEYLSEAIAQMRLHPMLAFSIGRKFNRKGWLRDALRKLQEIPVTSWVDDPQVLEWATPHDVLVVLRLREYTHISRLEFVCFRPPAVHATGCKNPQECSFLWDLAWALTVVPRIAHESYSPGELLLFVRDLEVEGMAEGCVKASRDDALRSDRFYVYDRGITKAIQLTY